MKFVGILCVVSILALGFLLIIPRHVKADPVPVFSVGGREGYVLDSDSNASTGSWHTVDVWKLTISAGAAPLALSVGILRHLADTSDKQQNGNDLDRSFKPETLTKEEQRHKKKTRKLRKLLAMTHSGVSWADILSISESVLTATMHAIGEL